MSEEDRQRLAQLGYLGAPEPEAERGRHPRDMIALKYRLDDAKRAVELGQLDEVHRILEEVSASDPDNPGIPEIRGVLLKESAASDPVARRGAIEAFERAIELSPENNRLWKHLADLQAWDGELKRAIACFEEALRRGPVPEEAQRTYGGWLERAGRFADAHRTLSQLRHFVETGAEEAIEAGHEALDDRRLMEALCHFDRAAETLPLESESLRRLAWKRAAEVAQRLGWDDALRARLDELLEQDSGDEWARRQREHLR